MATSEEHIWEQLIDSSIDIVTLYSEEYCNTTITYNKQYNQYVLQCYNVKVIFWKRNLLCNAYNNKITCFPTKGNIVEITYQHVPASEPIYMINGITGEHMYINSPLLNTLNYFIKNGYTHPIVNVWLTSVLLK